MKKRLTLIVALLLALCLLPFSACSSDAGSSGGGSGDAGNTGGSEAAAPDTVYELSFTIHDPATSAKVQYYEELAAKTKEATNGGVNITVYPGGTLVASTDVAEGVLTGAADIGWLYTAFFPGQFPLTEALSLPMIMDDSIQGTKAFQALLHESEALQEELSQYKVLGVYCNPIAYIYTVPPVHTVDDLSGLTLRCPAGVATDMLAAWGGTPILMGPGDVYQSMEKGVIDGFTYEWSGVGAFNLGEVIDNCTEIPIYVGEFITAMNLEKWNSLPAEYQEAMEEIWCPDEVSLDFAEMFMDDYDLARTTAIEELNVNIIEPTADEIATFKPAADAYIQQWIEDNTTDSFDAQAYYDRMLELLEEYAS